MSIQPPPVCNPDGIAWFLRHRDGVVHGPFPFGSLTEAARLGRIAADTMVSHPDFTNSAWVLALEIPEIAAAAPVSKTLPAISRMPEAATGTVSIFSRFRPDHPGKKIILAATLIWLAGLPIVSGYAMLQVYQGSELHAEPGLHTLNAWIVEQFALPAPQWYFVGRLVAWWSILYGLITIAGIVIVFSVPQRRWRPDITMA